jgi:hypothetical protein
MAKKAKEKAEAAPEQPAAPAKEEKPAKLSETFEIGVGKAFGAQIAMGRLIAAAGTARKVLAMDPSKPVKITVSQ